MIHLVRTRHVEGIIHRNVNSQVWPWDSMRCALKLFEVSKILHNVGSWLILEPVGAPSDFWLWSINSEEATVLWRNIILTKVLALNRIRSRKDRLVVWKFFIAIGVSDHCLVNRFEGARFERLLLIWTPWLVLTIRSRTEVTVVTTIWDSLALCFLLACLANVHY